MTPRSMWPTSRSVRGMLIERMFLATVAVGNSLTMGCQRSSVILLSAGGASAPVTQPAKMQKTKMDRRRFIVAPLFLTETALASEEIAEKLGTFIGQDSGGDFHAVIE